MKNTIKNPYSVTLKEIEIGSTFFVFFDGKFYEILIGADVRLDYMFINFPSKEKIRITIDELWTRVPDNWSGCIRYLN